MIKRVVIWKLKETAEGRSKAENTRRMKELLVGLRGKVPGLLAIEVGVNQNLSPASGDIAMCCQFESQEAADAFPGHPAHLEIKPFVASVRSDRLIVDWEVA